MSIVQAFKYIEENTAELGYTQWVEPFDKENIPSTIIDRTFFVEFNGSSREGQGNQTLSIRHEFDVSLFFKGYRNTKAESVAILTAAESVIQKLCGYNKTWQNINAVEFSRLELVPFDEQNNDNILVAVITLDVVLAICLTD